MGRCMIFYTKELVRKSRLLHLFATAVDEGLVFIWIVPFILYHYASKQANVANQATGNVIAVYKSSYIVASLMIACCLNSFHIILQEKNVSALCHVINLFRLRGTSYGTVKAYGKHLTIKSLVTQISYCDYIRMMYYSSKRTGQCELKLTIPLFLPIVKPLKN